MWPLKSIHSGSTCCSENSMLCFCAEKAGLTSERWTKETFDLSTHQGAHYAEARFRSLRPKRLWLSPPCGPFSAMRRINPRNPAQMQRLNSKRRIAYFIWTTCIHLTWTQLELGGKFYLEQPHTSDTWRFQDIHQTQLFSPQYSEHCVRYQRFDGLVHFKDEHPMRKSTRIQTDNFYFSRAFAQRCAGHTLPHRPRGFGYWTFNLLPKSCFFVRGYSQSGIDVK